VDSKAVLDVKLVDATADSDGTKAADDGKPKDGQKTDKPTVTPSTDSIQTLATADVTTVVPAPAPPHRADGEKIVELPDQASPVAELATQSKPIDLTQLRLLAGKSADSGKPVDSKKQDDSGQQVDVDQSADDPAVDSNATVKSALQLHPDKPQSAANDSDNQHNAQARGESPADGNRIAPDATIAVSADAGATTPNVSDNTVQPALTAAPAHTASTAAAPPALVTPASLQAAPIPLAGVPLEIASKAMAGKNRFEIRLDPPELGRIEVRLDVDRDGNVTSRLTVDRADTLDLLRRDATGLERALQDAGLKTADNSLQFTLRDQSMNQQQTNSNPTTAQLLVTDETIPSIDASLQNYGRLAGQGAGLDIRV
jgi:chemotaxis protein MotD